MRDDQLKVQTFMEKANQSVPLHPILTDVETLEKRFKWVREELQERLEAEEVLKGIYVILARQKLVPSIDDPGIQGVLCEIIDSWCDLLYFIFGDAVSMGLDLQPFFAEVHASNMSKFIDGRIGPDGKYMKGPSYRPPNLLPILKAQIAAGRERLQAGHTEGGAL